MLAYPFSWVEVLASHYLNNRMNAYSTVTLRKSGKKARYHSLADAITDAPLQTAAKI